MVSIRYKPFFLILLLIILCILTSCDTNEPVQLENTQLSIHELIESREENHDFLNDSSFINMVNNLIEEILTSQDINPNNYVIGNLSQSNIPEIIFYRERDKDNIHDPGYLEVYSYQDSKYSLLDRVGMNYDKSNYQMVIGQLSKDTRGLYLTNYAGSDSTVTYGFILRENKLENILNPKKINLVSHNDDNRISDYNNDGILEFTISTIDPENYNGSYIKDRPIKYRYNWDGSDGAILVHVDKEPYDREFALRQSDEETLDRASKYLNAKSQEFLNYLLDKKNDLSPYHISLLLEEYISYLDASAFIEENRLQALIHDSSIDSNTDLLRDKYSISLELLNDREYINRKKILSNELDLKNFIIKTLNSGYVFDMDKDSYIIKTNYRFFYDNFKDSIRNEYKDYLRILSHYAANNMEKVSLDTIAERIILIENYLLTYPYSSKIEDLESYREEYLAEFFKAKPLQIGQENLKESSLTFKRKLTDKYKEIKDKYYYSYFSDLIDKYFKK